MVYAPPAVIAALGVIVKNSSAVEFGTVESVLRTVELSERTLLNVESPPGCTLEAVTFKLPVYGIVNEAAATLEPAGICTALSPKGAPATEFTTEETAVCVVLVPDEPLEEPEDPDEPDEVPVDPDAPVDPAPGPDRGAGATPMLLHAESSSTKPVAVSILKTFIRFLNP